MTKDLFDEELKNSKITIWDSLIDTIYPKNIQEYSRIIINDEKSEIFNSGFVNLLSTTPNLLNSINPNNFHFYKDQVLNLASSLSEQNIMDENFKRKIVSQDGNILPLDSTLLSSFSAIDDVNYVYSFIKNGVNEGKTKLSKKDYNLFYDNLYIVRLLDRNLKNIKNYLIENNNIIQNRIK